MLVKSPKESKQAFRKAFDQLSRSRGYAEVFSDFLDFALLMMNINKQATDFETLEKKYTTSEEHKLFAEMFYSWADASEGFHDALGDLFMECISFGRNGQFFTPEEICLMMAKMTIGENPEDGKTVVDPACGSGRTLLAGAKINRKMKFYGSDNDLICAKMTTLNLLANTLEGEVAHMNALTMEHYKSWHISKMLVGTHYLPVYRVTGPGETNFIETTKDTPEVIDDLKVIEKAMKYSEYGLDAKKTSNDPNIKHDSHNCLWCNEDVKSGFNLCFSNWVICRDCVETANEPENQNRWKTADACFKCGTTNTQAFAAHSIYTDPFHICGDCITWAKETFTKQDDFNNKTREQMTTEEILQQCRVEGQLIRLPDVMLDYQSEYVPVKKKLELIGGKWKGGKTNAFVFDEDPTDLLTAIQNGQQVNLKKEFQFFPTPEHLADTLAGRAMTEYFKSNSGMPRVLEPSAGDGALVKAIQRRFKDLQVDCCELMELNRIRLEKIPNLNIVGEDFLKAVEIDDTNRIRSHYDLIIANPPFSKNQDIDHIRAMFECLKPGGTIVTMAGPSWKIGSQKKQVEFQQWLADLGAEIIEVDAGEFKSSGTMIGTLILVIAKPASIEKSLIIESVNGVSKMVDGSEALEFSCEKVALPEPQEILNDVRNDCQIIDQNLNEKEQIINNDKSETEMSFFKQLSGIIGQVEMSFTIKEKDGELTVMIMPKATGSMTQRMDKIKPLIITGSPEDLDEGFFATVSTPLVKTGKLLSNAADYEKNLNAAANSSEESTEKESKPKRNRNKAAAQSPEKESSDEAPEVNENAEAPEIDEAEEQRRKEEEELRIKREEEEKLENERKEKFNALLTESITAASANNFREAASALKKAKEFSQDPETLNDKIKEYIAKAIDAEMAEI